MSPDASRYLHEPLQDARIYIRLLQILQPYDPNGTIRCTLKPWLVEEAPPYYAISYTWGDPALTTNIIIDGQNMVVRQNCEYVLRQAYAAKPDAHFWVDAICINQVDDDEKGHQVAIMATFYQRAVKVLACVGPHGSDSQFLSEIINKYRNVFVKKHEAIRREQQNREIDCMETYVPKGGDSTRLWGRLFGHRSQMAYALALFLSRPYFQRVWVLQELYMGNGKISICFGMDRQPFGFIYAMIIWTGSMARRGKHLKGAVDVLLGEFIKRQPNFDFEECPDGSVKYIATRDHAFNLGAGYGLSPAKLQHVLDVVSDLDCEDPRDRLYGVLNLVNWNGRKIPAPDYKKTVLELLKDIIDMVLMWRPKESFRVSLIGISCTIIKAMRLRAQDQESLQEIIDTIGHSQALTPMVEKRLAPSRRADIWWSGTKLSLSPGKGDLSFRKPQAGSDQHTAIFDDDQNTIAYAPPTVQEGDWFLESFDERGLARLPFDVKTWARCLHGNRYRRVVLIVRPVSVDRCVVIGPVFPIGDLRTAALKPICFKIWWHPQDALVLGWLQSRHVPTEINQELFPLTKNPLCVYPGSTLVLGPYDPWRFEQHLLESTDTDTDTNDVFKEPNWSVSYTFR